MTIFLLSVVMVFKTGCTLVTVEMKMYIYVHMPSGFFCCFLFSFFVAETSPSVQFVTASLGNVVMEKQKKIYTKMCNNKS